MNPDRSDRVVSMALGAAAAWLLSGWIEPPLLGAWLGVFGYFVVLGFALVWRFRQGSWRNAGLELR